MITNTKYCLRTSIGESLLIEAAETKAFVLCLRKYMTNVCSARVLTQVFIYRQLMSDILLILLFRESLAAQEWGAYLDLLGVA